MATVAWFGKGTKLQRDTGGSGAFIDIANITSISGPSATSDQIDITSHNTTTRFRETIGGLQDGGEVNASVNYDPTVAYVAGDDADGTGHNRLMQELEDGTEDNYKIIFPDAGNHEVLFPGVVSSVSLNSPIDGVHTMAVYYTHLTLPTKA